MAPINDGSSHRPQIFGVAFLFSLRLRLQHPQFLPAESCLSQSMLVGEVQEAFPPLAERHSHGLSTNTSWLLDLLK